MQTAMYTNIKYVGISQGGGVTVMDCIRLLMSLISLVY